MKAGVLYNAVNVSANTTTVTVNPIDSGKVYTNEGASSLVTHNLPTAVANYQYTFIVQDADGIKVVANTGDTIRVGANVSISAGYIQSTTIGSTLCLVAINATEWYATFLFGSWDLQTS